MRNRLQETHCGELAGMVKNLLKLKMLEAHYTASGVRCVFEDSQGECYEITIKPYEKEQPDEMV